MEVDNVENSNSQPRRILERKSRYRDLLNKAEAIQETDNVGIQAVTDVGEILTEANKLNSEVDIEQRVGNADETLLDCLVLSSASGILKKCIAAVDVYTTTYDSSEFANKIVAEVKKDDEEEMTPEDILKLLTHARIIIPNLPRYNSTYGSYDLNHSPEPKLRKVREKVVKEQLEKKQPEKITAVNKEEEGIEEIVKELSEVLEKAYSKNEELPINYYDYIIDSDSYSKTIENMFYFAFLIRDGKASIDLDKNGVPVIKSMHKKDLKSYRETDGKNTQIITAVTMDIWQKHNKVGLLQKHRQKKRR